MLVNKPMFPGSTIDEQLNLIFQKLGTPNPDFNPTMCELSFFKCERFKTYLPKTLIQPPRITAERADLLQSMLRVKSF